MQKLFSEYESSGNPTPASLREVAAWAIERGIEQDRQQAGIESDWIVDLISQQRARLPILLRCIMLRREDGRLLTILSNDIGRPAAEIAALYRKRWQIELLFRWIKQHLKIRSFLGRSENAIRLQILAVMIAYLLLRIAERDSRSGLLALRFADLVRTRLFERRPVAAIDKPQIPPGPIPTSKINSVSPMLDFPGQPCAQAGIQSPEVSAVALDPSPGGRPFRAVPGIRGRDSASNGRAGPWRYLV